MPGTHKSNLRGPPSLYTYEEHQDLVHQEVCKAGDGTALLLAQTSEEFSLADGWLCLWQRAMGMVFHTASFDESKVADTIQRLRQDVSWVAKVTRMTIPRNVASLDLVVLQPTTMKTIFTSV